MTCDVWWAAPVATADAPGLVALLDAHERARLGKNASRLGNADFGEFGPIVGHTVGFREGVMTKNLVVCNVQTDELSSP